MSTDKIGEYIYMGMGKVNGQRVCMAVAYKLDYCVKKALQFEAALQSETGGYGRVFFDKVNKVKVGCLEAETEFSRSELSEYEYKFNYGK